MFENCRGRESDFVYFHKPDRFSGHEANKKLENRSGLVIIPALDDEQTEFHIVDMSDEFFKMVQV